MNFDNFYEALQKLAEKYEKLRREVHSNPDLSNEGKRKKLAEIQRELELEAGKVKKEFEASVSKLEENFEKTITPLDRWEEIIKKSKEKLFKDINSYYTLLGDLDAKSEDLRFLVLANELKELSRSLQQHAFTIQINNLDNKKLEDLVGRLYESKDVDTLTMLREATKYSRDHISIAADKFIGLISDERMSPVQKRAKEDLASLEREKAFFEYSFANLVERSKYVNPKISGAQGQVLTESDIEALKSQGVNVISGGNKL